MCVALRKVMESIMSCTCSEAYNQSLERNRWPIKTVSRLKVKIFGPILRDEEMLDCVFKNVTAK